MPKGNSAAITWPIDSAAIPLLAVWGGWSIQGIAVSAIAIWAVFLYVLNRQAGGKS